MQIRNSWPSDKFLNNSDDIQSSPKFDIYELNYYMDLVNNVT